jgi:hypothetical protein
MTVHLVSDVSEVLALALEPEAAATLTDDVAAA